MHRFPSKSSSPISRLISKPRSLMSAVAVVGAAWRVQGLNDQQLDFQSVTVPCQARRGSPGGCH